MKIQSIIIISLCIVNIFFSMHCCAQQKKNVDACIISQNIDSYLALTKSDTIKLILAKSNENCNLRLVDSLCGKFLKISNQKYFDLFANVANNSDGYVSEYIVEKMGKVYYLRFEPLFNFLYEENTHKKKNKLEYFLIECWSIIAASADNSTNEIHKIRKNTQSIVAKQQNETQNKIKYLNSLLSKINPKYLD